MLKFLFLLTLLFTLETPQTTAYQMVTVHSGPSFTFRETGTLNPGVPVSIIERNRAGTWVRVTRTNPSGEIVLDGWTVTGYLNYEGNYHLSTIPVNQTIADADPTTVEFASVGELYAVPVIPPVSSAMLGVYKYGQALGNHSNVLTKVGDSVSANPLYLNPLSRDDYELGPYDFLEDSINYFGPALSDSSVASRIGMTTYVVFDPLWADKTLCTPGESPLQCEYRLSRPSIAIILFGPNDVRHMTDIEFGEQMRQLVDETLALGIIPVLSTFSVDPEDELWWQSINFNLRLAEIAQEYEVPLINFWAAARLLPDYGLDEDAIHVANSGFPNLKYTTGHEAWYGTSLQNLLALVMLGELRHTLDMN